MKLKGQSLSGMNYGVVTVTRGGQEFEFKLAPVESGWYQLAQSRLGDFPKAPVRPVRDEKGEYVHNRVTNAIEMRADEDDPAYQKASSKFYRRWLALKLKNHLRDDEAVDFEATEPDGKAEKDAWKTYADQVHKEMTEFGLTETEIAEMCNIAGELANSVQPDAGLSAFLRRTKSDS